MRILALDVGHKRIGVAVSDTTCTVANGVTTIEPSSENVILRLKQLCDEYDVDQVVVGIPLKTDRSESAQAKKIRQFIKITLQELNLPIKEWDERLTSKQAEKTLIEGGVRRAKRKQIIDRVAAILILQNYLDNLNKKARP